MSKRWQPFPFVRQQLVSIKPDNLCFFMWNNIILNHCDCHNFRNQISTGHWPCDDYVANMRFCLTFKPEKRGDEGHQYADEISVATHSVCGHYWLRKPIIGGIWNHILHCHLIETFCSIFIDLKLYTTFSVCGHYWLCKPIIGTSRREILTV